MIVNGSEILLEAREGAIESMPRFDVFLSHNSVDKPWVIKLKEALFHYGVLVWLDQDEIRPGDLFAKALEQALDDCRAVAIIVSPEALVSGWVREEYYRALSLAQKKQSPVQVIPVLLRNAELPGFLQERNWVDFREGTIYNESIWKLVWGITGEKPSQILDLNAPDLVSMALFTRRTKISTANATDIDYKHDVFLSHPHDPLFDEWVYDIFYPLFEGQLRNVLNRPVVNIFVDRERNPGDTLPQYLKNALAHSRCFIAILAPSYFHSTQCKQMWSIMCNRERQLDSKTKLMLAVRAHDGHEHFADIAQQPWCRDFTKFARTGEGFKRTSAYVEFQEEMEVWVHEEVAKVIKNAPPWRKEWLDDPLLDDSTSNPSSTPPPAFGPPRW